MSTHAERPVPYEFDDRKPEPVRRRYGWTALLYISFAALIILLFLMVR